MEKFKITIEVILSAKDVKEMLHEAGTVSVGQAVQNMIDEINAVELNSPEEDRSQVKLLEFVLIT